MNTALTGLAVCAAASLAILGAWAYWSHRARCRTAPRCTHCRRPIHRGYYAINGPAGQRRWHIERPACEAAALAPPPALRKDRTVTDPTKSDELTGSYGTARRVPRANYPDAPATLDAWIITAPCWHPLWSQYLLSLITLADVPGVEAAHKERPDVTHQLIVMTLNPEHGPYDAATVACAGFLTPGNIGEQFTATDTQALALAALCARAVVDGVLVPETADAPDRIRAAWRQSIQQTLDHDRNSHHGHLN